MKYLLSIFIFIIHLTVYPQSDNLLRADSVVFTATHTALKTNIVYNATSTVNLGIELRTAAQYTLDISVNYNPWTFSENMKLKHLLIQPEFRYWTCEVFNGHFLGTHLLYARYNVGGINLPLISNEKLATTRYQGNLFGAGFSYGYQWYLLPRWNLEAVIGLGYAFLDYTAHECKTCGKELYKKNKHYLGPTKAGVSLIYIIQ